jgi:hypothetical protein
MKKKIYFLAISAFLLLLNTADVLAGAYERNFSVGWGIFRWFKNLWNGFFNDGATDAVNVVSNTDPAVGAPLDGGLLALLAAAGVGYFAVRRKKKNKE